MKMAASIGIGACMALGACATVTDRTLGTITVDGIQYTTVTRTFEQNGRTQRTGDVIYSGMTYGCDTSTPGACEAVVRQLRLTDTSRSTDNVVNSSSFIIPGMN